MKTLKIFLRDCRANMRNFLSLWILIVPVIIAAIINMATPGITDSFLSIAMLEDTRDDKVSFYQQYANVELFDHIEQVEKRIMSRDFCFGVLPDDIDGYYILAQGNEPQTMVDAIKLLKAYEEKGEEPSGDVSFTDFGRTASPLKSTLITGLLILVTILSGMLISLGIVDEKSDKTIRAMKVTPVSTTSYIIGKSMIGVVYTLVCGLAILFVSDYFTGNVLQIFIVLIASSFISLIVGFLVGLTSEDFIEAAGNVKLIMIPAIIPVLVTELAPDKWHFLTWWSPFYWGYDAVKGLLNQTVSLNRVLVNGSIIIFIACIIYIILLPKVRQKLK
ncbi:MAG: ABC transporter permease [Epulopiscium sp.]|nr:ABC transporter permease [Candidatus Epulonipiscium sp.]